MNKAELENIIKNVSWGLELDYSFDEENIADIFVNHYSSGNISYGINHIDTQYFNKRGYQKFERLCDKSIVTKPAYEFYVSYDVSGYNYWTIDMKESNYICVVITIKDYNGDFSTFEDDLERFILDIQDKYEHLLSIKSYVRKSYESVI